MTGKAMQLDSAVCKLAPTFVIALVLAHFNFGPLGVNALENGVGRVPAMGWNSW